MEFIFCLACIAVGIYILNIRFNTPSDSDSRNGMDFINVADNIDRINELNERLRVIEELICDIAVCSPKEHHKAVSFEWTSSSGKKKQYDIWVDGNCRNTKDILKFAYSERERLRCSLRYETKKLSEKCGGNYVVINKSGRK